ncbi:MAG: diguanylate cyclase [Thermodesulfobacteriota bacterium]
MKILIVEDDSVTRRLLDSFLSGWGYNVQLAVNGSEAWEMLQNPDAPNLLVSDWMMPEMDGLELCRRIRAMGKPGYIYFIILTAKGGKEDIVKGLEAGADDFLVKPFSHEELKCRIHIGERILKLEERILQLANTDALTGVLNRRAFMHRMEEELHRAVRRKEPFSLIMVDVDHFKKTNDTYGHQVGDLVLKKFANILVASIRPYDLTARYGGEEFVLCLPATNGLQAGSVAERIRGNVAAEAIKLADDSTSFWITASFGVATYSLGADEPVDAIIKRADDALYKAKQEGRNRVCLAA